MSQESISNELSTLSDIYDNVIDKMNDDSNINSDEYSYPFDGITEGILLEDAQDFCNYIRDYSSDILLWAQQTDNYICTSLDAYDKVINLYVFLKSNEFYNISDTQIKICQGIVNDMLSLLNDTPDGYTQTFFEKYQEFKLYRQSYDNMLYIIDSANTLLNIFKDNLKVLTTVNTALAITPRAWDIMNKINNTNAHIYNETIIDDTLVEEIDTDFEDANLFIDFDKYIIDLDYYLKYINNITYYCLSNSTYKVNDTYKYQMIHTESDKEFLELTSINDIYSADINNITNEDFPEDVKIIFGNKVFFDNIIYDEEDIELYYDTLNTEYSLNEFKLYIQEDLIRHKQIFEEENIINYIEGYHQIKGSIGLQLLLRSEFNRSTNIYNITLPTNDLNIKYDIYNNKYNNLKDIEYLIFDYYQYKFNNIENSNDLYFNYSSNYLNYLDYKYINNQGKSSILYLQNDVVIKQLSEVYYKYNTYQNSFNITGGVFSIIRDNQQFNCILTGDTLSFTINKKYDNYEKDQELLITDDIQSDISINNISVFVGNEITLPDEYHQILNYDIIRENRSLSYENNLATIDNYHYKGYYVLDDKTQSLAHDHTDIKLNYIHDNGLVRVATNQAYHYRILYLKGALSYAEASAKAVLRSFNYLGVKDNQDKFVEEYNNTMIPIPEFTVDDI